MTPYLIHKPDQISTEKLWSVESFHYISANIYIFKHHDLLDFFHTCKFDRHLNMIVIEFGIFEKSFTAFEILSLQFYY